MKTTYLMKWMPALKNYRCLVLAIRGFLIKQCHRQTDILDRECKLAFVTKVKKF